MNILLLRTGEFCLRPWYISQSRLNTNPRMSHNASPGTFVTAHERIWLDATKEIIIMAIIVGGHGTRVVGSWYPVSNICGYHDPSSDIYDPGYILSNKVFLPNTLLVNISTITLKVRYFKYVHVNLNFKKGGHGTRVSPT